MTLERFPANPTPRCFDPADFGLGVLVPVVGGHPGAGASGLALALADAGAAAGLTTLLIDGADPARSGLADVWTARLRSDPPGMTGAVISTTRRAKVIGRQLAGAGQPFPARSYPSLPEWANAEFLRQYGPFDLTVVDVGWNAWPGFNQVRFGPLAWVGARAKRTMPLLVGLPTAPSLRLTAGVHARWSAALASAEVETTPRLVLANACSVPASVSARTPPSMSELLDDAHLMPRDHNAAFAGWSLEPLPAASVTAAAHLLTQAPESVAARMPMARRNPSRFRRFPKES